MAKNTVISDSEKLSSKDIVFYGLGGAASTMTTQFKNSFSMPFLTDIAGISMSTVGIWTSVMTLWDAVNDPIIGRIADRTNTKRFGKYRPHMMIGCILWALTTILLFTLPPLQGLGKSAYYLSLLCLFSIFSTQFTVPWQALNSVMSNDPHQRNLLLVSRQLVAFIATAISGIIFEPLISAFPDEKTGWLVTSCVVALICIVSGLLCADGAKKKDYYNSIRTPEKSNAKTEWNIIFKNRAVLCVAIMLGCVSMISMVTSVLNYYYANLVVHNLKLIGIFSVITLIISVIVFPVMPAVLKRLGKIKTLFIGIILTLAVPVTLIIFREKASMAVIIVSNVIYGVGFLCANVATLGMIPDCIDYTEFKFGTAQAGFINSVITFMRKVFRSAAQLIIGALLGLVGYSVDPNTPAVMNMILSIKIIFPAILVVVLLITLKLYPITREFGKDMRNTLKERRNQQ